jgi:hypothetical protein
MVACLGDNDADDVLLPDEVTGPDEDGIITVVSYKFDEQDRKKKVRSRSAASPPVLTRALVLIGCRW